MLAVLSPWDTAEARRMLLALISVAGVMSVLAGLITQPDSLFAWSGVVGFPLLLAGLGTAMHRFHHRLPDAFYSVVALIGELTFVPIVFTSGVKLSAIEIYCFVAVMYMALQLRRPLAGLGVVVASLLVVVAAVRQEPVAAALLDIVFAVPAYVTLAVVLVRSGEERRRLADRLRERAAIDPLTGLATRRVLDEAARGAMSDSMNGTALIMVDVDRFKSVNDTYGHPAGDEALKHIARILERHTRQGSVICRIGGDEMAVLIPGCSDETAFQRGLELVTAVRASPLPLPDGRLVQLSITVGVGHAPHDLTQLSSLYAAADAALYGAKKAGRNRVGRSPGVRAT